MRALQTQDAADAVRALTRSCNTSQTALMAYVAERKAKAP